MEHNVGIRDEGSSMGSGYPIALVGEQHYQSAIASCASGEEVLLWHEPQNPYDERALAVSDARGRTLGYLPRDSFVHEACLAEGKGFAGRILSIEEGRSTDFRHVTIEVELLPKHERPIAKRDFAQR